MSRADLFQQLGLPVSVYISGPKVVDLGRCLFILCEDALLLSKKFQVENFTVNCNYKEDGELYISVKNDTELLVGFVSKHLHGEKFSFEVTEGEAKFLQEFPDSVLRVESEGVLRLPNGQGHWTFADVPPSVAKFFNN